MIFYSIIFVFWQILDETRYNEVTSEKSNKDVNEMNDIFFDSLEEDKSLPDSKKFDNVVPYFKDSVVMKVKYSSLIIMISK